jgi:cation/acetate symporter
MQTAAHNSGKGHAFLEPGLLFKEPLSAISTGVAFGLGTAGLPHILMRFFTVPSAKAARGSVGWAVTFIGCFYLMIGILGFGTMAVLGSGAEKAAGGDVFIAVISGIAFATILAVVAGLVISASGAIAHDIYANVLRRDRGDEGDAVDSDARAVAVGKIAAAVIGAAAILVAILAGPGFNVQFLVGLAFSIAASANFPALILALTWRRFNTTGALVGVAVGLVSSITLIILSPAVWPGPDSQGSPFPLSNPAIVSVPLGFIGCILGTLLAREREAERSHGELRVRAETGVGAEA